MSTTKRICISLDSELHEQLKDYPGGVSYTISTLLEYAIAAGYMQRLSEIRDTALPEPPTEIEEFGID